MLRIFQLFTVKNSRKIFPEGDLKRNFVIFSHLASLYPPNNKSRHPLSLQKILSDVKNAEHPKDSQTKWKRKREIDLKAISAEISTNFPLFLWIVNLSSSNPSVYVLRIINEKSYCNSPCGCKIKIKLSPSFFAYMRTCTCEMLNHAVVVGRFS